MKKIIPIKIYLLICAYSFSSVLTSFAQNFVYPFTLRQPVYDTIFNKIIVDEYRWMEDLNNQRVKDWLKTQSEFTNSFLDKIPGRNVLIEEYKMLDSLKNESINGISLHGNRYFYRKTMIEDNISKLYYRDGLSGIEILLFDPVSYDAESVIAFTYLASNDGKKVSLSFSKKGKEVYTDRIINVDSKKFYEETIFPGSIYGGYKTWTPDSKGFLYTAPKDSNYLSKDYYQNVQLKYHIVGNAPKYDRIILSAEHNQGMVIKPEELITSYFSLDRKYLIVSLFSGFQNKNKSFYIPAAALSTNKINWKPLTSPADRIEEATILNENFYFLSKKDAPKGKLMMTPLKKLDIHNAKTIIPESDSVIAGWTFTKDFLVVRKLTFSNSYLYRHNLKTGEIKAINLPNAGHTWVSISSINSNVVMLSVDSWKQPITRYLYELTKEKNEYSPLNRIIKYPGVDELVLEKIEVTGHDGVKVPMSLVYNKKVKKDGTNIVYMTGYGAYGNNNNPHTDITLLPLYNRGVIVAFTHTRGGGEKGAAWHEAGLKTTKPNTWKDFISCAEYLISNGYTLPQYIIGHGGSAGGILIGRAITDRPDLFAASIHEVPVSNAYRHENRSIGGTDANEFGTLKDSTEAMALLEMDAYQNVRIGTKYPAVLATSGINDGRVPAWQPGKLVAAIQKVSTSNRPVFLYVNYNSGHASSEKSVRFKLSADAFAFALWQVGHKDFQIKSD